MSHDSHMEVWMDGDCRLCRRSRQWVELRDERGAVLFKDFRGAADSALPLSRTRVEAQMWARTADGRLYGGFAAWRQILAEIPRWRWLARLTALPPFSWGGALGYRLVARFRHRIRINSIQR